MIKDGLTFSVPIVLPTTSTDTYTIPHLPKLLLKNALCHYISKTANTILWHQRLIHQHDRGLSKIHTAFKGVQKLTPRQEIDHCDICLT